MQVHTDAGLIGLGETFFGPRAVESYLHETAVPLLLGRDPLQIDAISKQLSGYLGFASTGTEMRGNSAIDIALWDHFGKLTGQPIAQLNELEMVEGELFSNVWGTDLILRIDPGSGKVKGVINLEGLLPPAQRGTLDPDAVLNGISWDSKGKRLFVTGKLWPKLYEIELVPRKR